MPELEGLDGGRHTSRPPSSPSSSGIPAPRTGGSDPPKADDTKPGLFGRFFKKT
jgi:hypothetical protein